MENISLSQIEKETILDSLIISKINTCIAILGGESDLLSIVSSFKSTLTNKEVFESLNCWIEISLRQKETNLKELLEYSNR